VANGAGEGGGVAVWPLLVQQLPEFPGGVWLFLEERAASGDERFDVYPV
jgi:hypothetical protein